MTTIHENQYAVSDATADDDYVLRDGPYMTGDLHLGDDSVLSFGRSTWQQYLAMSADAQGALTFAWPNDGTPEYAIYDRLGISIDTASGDVIVYANEVAELYGGGVTTLHGH